jgi:hypothetical protein
MVLQLAKWIIASKSTKTPKVIFINIYLFTKLIKIINYASLNKLPRSVKKSNVQ